MPVNSYKDLRVFQNAMGACMEIFELTKKFPPEEKFALVDQVRRSSRAVCAILAEAWRARRYPAAFSAKLDSAAGEAGETQVWIEIAKQCGYLGENTAVHLDDVYEHIVAQLISISRKPEPWLIAPRTQKTDSGRVDLANVRRSADPRGRARECNG
jgi:four helix bundle protein